MSSPNGWPDFEVKRMPPLQMKTLSCEENGCSIVVTKEVVLFLDTERLAKLKPRCDCVLMIGNTVFLIELKTIRKGKDLEEIKSKLPSKMLSCQKVIENLAGNYGLEVNKICKLLVVSSKFVNLLKRNLSRSVAKGISVLPCGSTPVCYG